MPPFHEIERGFYKSTASVYLGFGVLAFAGRCALLCWPPAGAAVTRDRGRRAGAVAGVADGAARSTCTACGATTFRRRARAYVIAWMSGVAALAVGAQLFRLGPLLSLETVLYPINFVVSALVLGAVTTGMLLGHWYLIDRDLSIDPFRTHLPLLRRARWPCRRCLLLVSGGLLPLAGASASATG